MFTIETKKIPMTIYALSSGPGVSELQLLELVLKLQTQSGKLQIINFLTQD